MQHDIHRSLRMLRDRERGINPDPAWVSATRSRLLMQVRNTIATPEVAAKNRRFIAMAYPSLLRVVRAPALVVLSVIAVVFGGSLASVRAADQSLPGDALFMLKLVTEQTRIAFEKSKVGKVKLKVEFTKRRANELKTIVTTPVSNKEERVNKAADILKQDLHTLKEQLRDVKDDATAKNNDAVVEAAKVVEKETVEVVKTLKETSKDELTSDAKMKMADAEAQAADVGIQAVEVLVTANAADGQKVTSEELAITISQHMQVVQTTVDSILQDSASSSLTMFASSTESTTSTLMNASTTDAMAKDAAVTLQQVQVLMGESNPAEAITKLKEASTKTFLAQTEVQKTAAASPVDGAALGGNASSTPQVVNSALEPEEEDIATTTKNGG